MRERGVLIERFGRAPRWRLWGLFMLLSLLAEPFLWRWYTEGVFGPPPWLLTQPGAVVTMALVMGVVGLSVDVMGNVLSGERYVAALYANGLMVRQRLRERFIPWTEVRSMRVAVRETWGTTVTGTPTRGPLLRFFEVDCGGDLVLVRETEGGTNTADLIAARAKLSWTGTEAVRG